MPSDSLSSPNARNMRKRQKKKQVTRTKKKTTRQKLPVDGVKISNKKICKGRMTVGNQGGIYLKGLRSQFTERLPLNVENIARRDEDLCTLIDCGLHVPKAKERNQGIMQRLDLDTTVDHNTRPKDSRCGALLDQRPHRSSHQEDGRRRHHENDDPDPQTHLNDSERLRNDVTYRERSTLHRNDGEQQRIEETNLRSSEAHSATLQWLEDCKRYLNSHTDSPISVENDVEPVTLRRSQRNAAEQIGGHSKVADKFGRRIDIPSRSNRFMPLDVTNQRSRLVERNHQKHPENTFQRLEKQCADSEFGFLSTIEPEPGGFRPLLSSSPYAKKTPPLVSKRHKEMYVKQTKRQKIDFIQEMVVGGRGGREECNHGMDIGLQGQRERDGHTKGSENDSIQCIGRGIARNRVHKDLRPRSQEPDIFQIVDQTETTIDSQGNILRGNRRIQEPRERGEFIPVGGTHQQLREGVLRGRQRDDGTNRRGINENARISNRYEWEAEETARREAERQARQINNNYFVKSRTNSRASHRIEPGEAHSLKLLTGEDDVVEWMPRHFRSCDALVGGIRQSNERHGQEPEPRSLSMETAPRLPARYQLSPTTSMPSVWAASVCSSSSEESSLHSDEQEPEETLRPEVSSAPRVGSQDKIWEHCQRAAGEMEQIFKYFCSKISAKNEVDDRQILCNYYMERLRLVEENARLPLYP